MRRRIVSRLAVLAAAALLVSCSDDSGRRSGLTNPLGPQARTSDIVPGTCTTYGNLTSLVNAVFGAGSPNANSALGKLNNLNKQLQSNNLAGAQSQAQNIVQFVLQKAQSGTLPGTHDQVEALLGGVLCFAGLSPDTFLIFPSDQPQILKSNNGQAGLSLQGNTVNTPTLITITFLPNNAPPLITKLDQYPGFIELTQSSPLTKPAIVAVCPASSVPPGVVNHLRMGHQAATGFEITPAADASFLNCSVTVGQSKMPGWLQRLASFVLPTPLYAKTFEGVGVGGLATEFSPFAPVDDELFLDSPGVGGTLTEFQKLPSRGDSLTLRMPSVPGDASSTATRALVPGNRSNTLDQNGNCIAIDALVGAQVETACRPTIRVRTYQGTPLQNVPMGWVVASGGGTIAPAPGCTPFASSASTATDATGSTSICWTLGPTPGPNTVKAGAMPGGDAPLGVIFQDSVLFTATGKQLTPTVTATNAGAVYDGQPHAGIGTCTPNALIPALTYSINGSAPTNVAPTDVGQYTVTVTCGAGNPLYVTVNAQATLTITPAPTTIAISCPASAVYTGAAQTCSATATATGTSLNAPATLSYSPDNINAGTVNVTATYAGGGNYLGSNNATSFQIGQAKTTTSLSCPVSVGYNGSAQTPCSAPVTGAGLNNVVATVQYTSNTNVGTANVSATYTGDANHLASNAVSSFLITGAATTATVSCPASVTYTGSPVTPCTGLVTGMGGLSQAVTPVYTNNTVGVATATVSYAGGGNYLPSGPVSANFNILYAQSGCFASPVYSVMPSTKSFQNKGSNLQIKCVLQTATGGGVSNATGSILVQDKGTDGLGTPVTVFSLANAFKSSGSGNYGYGLDTSPAGFVSGHYYYITATWSDGSTTNGWFFIK
jgi:hypothetical protein